MKKVLIIAMLLTIACSAYAIDRVSIDTSYGVPSVGFKLNDTQTVDVGLGYSSTNNGAATSLWLTGKLENNIMTLEKTKLYWAGQIAINSAGGTSTLWLDGIVGGEYKITKNLGIFANIYLLTISSGGGSSSLWLATQDGNAYTGLRIYLD